MHITLSRNGELAADVYRQLRGAILDGRLRAGDRLPATRDFADRLGVSRNTVLAAFAQLVAEGFATGHVGAGTFVADVGPLLARRAPAGDALKPRRTWSTAIAELAPPGRSSERPARPHLVGRARFDFGIGTPDPALFPWDAWRHLVARQLRGRRRFVGYPPPEGDPALREAIARHLGLARSVIAGADDVLVTSGAQQAIDLVTRVLLEPGACVAIEEPGYTAARLVFAAAGARVVPVPVDADGLVVDRLPRDAKLVYVTPSHQFPLGMVMSLPRRLALLAWAERHRAAIVEDDYDSEFRFAGRPLEPLQSLDRTGRVLYVGSFSKTLLPTLRQGFVIAPRSLMPALRAAKLVADSHGPLALQRALAELIADGTFARHVRRVVKIYGERRAALLAALEGHPSLEVVPSSAGLHVSCFLTRDARVRDPELVVHSLAPFYMRRPRPGVALGFGLIATQDIDEGIRRLAASGSPRRPMSS